MLATVLNSCWTLTNLILTVTQMREVPFMSQFYSKETEAHRADTTWPKITKQQVAEAGPKRYWWSMYMNPSLQILGKPLSGQIFLTSLSFSLFNGKTGTVPVLNDCCKVGYNTFGRAYII